MNPSDPDRAARPPVGMVKRARRRRLGAPAATGTDQRFFVIIVAVSLLIAVGAVVTVILLARTSGDTAGGPSNGPLAVPAAPAEGAGGRYCDELLGVLPDDLAGEPRRELAVEEPGVAAWGDPAIILRCGLDDPVELTCSAALTDFKDRAGNVTSWLRLSDASAVTYIAVDRPVRIGVTLPADSTAGVAPIQQLSEVIARALPARPVCSGGTITPPDNS